MPVPPEEEALLTTQVADWSWKTTHVYAPPEETVTPAIGNCGLTDERGVMAQEASGRRRGRKGRRRGRTGRSLTASPWRGAVVAGPRGAVAAGPRGAVAAGPRGVVAAGPRRGAVVAGPRRGNLPVVIGVLEVGRW